MKEWFMSGGFGMFMVLAIGVAAIGYGFNALREPTTSRMAALRALPALLVTTALFAFGTNMWAVNRALSNAAYLKDELQHGTEAPIIGFLGLTEATQVLTLGGLLAMVVVVLRMVAESRHAKGKE